MSTLLPTPVTKIARPSRPFPFRSTVKYKFFFHSSMSLIDTINQTGKDARRYDFESDFTIYSFTEDEEPGKRVVTPPYFDVSGY